jgi:hypothetical protein
MNIDIFRVYEEYGNKMEKYMVQVADLESSNCIYQKVYTQQDKVANLLEESEYMQSFCYVNPPGPVLSCVL